VTRGLTQAELWDPAAWRGLLGTRVSLRYRLRGDPDHPFSEAIGMVQAVTDGAVTVVTRRGEEVRVGLRDVLAAKTFST
jgi:hypothetical protein